MIPLEYFSFTDVWFFLFVSGVEAMFFSNHSDEKSRKDIFSSKEQIWWTVNVDFICESPFTPKSIVKCNHFLTTSELMRMLNFCTNVCSKIYQLLLLIWEQRKQFVFPSTPLISDNDHRYKLGVNLSDEDADKNKHTLEVITTPKL